jgi:uncharacterized protein (TIGR02145 family)
MSLTTRKFFLLMISVFVISIFVSCEEEEEEERVIERGTLTDNSGRVYRTVRVGNKWWMAENLSVKRFNNGDEIPFVSSQDPDNIWANVEGPGMTFTLDSTVGFLYNYDCLLDARGIAPEGWHIPTDDDWKNLEKEVGMSSSEINNTGWRGQNEAALLTSKNSLGWAPGVLFGTDEFGFDARSSGVRIFDGRRNLSGKVAFWWTLTENGDDVWYRYFDSDQTRIFRHYTHKNYAMAIRLVKDI